MKQKRLKTKKKELKLTTLGFTLIELLAVIVILAIIALIAIPQVLDIIEDSNKKSIVLSVENYIRAVNTALINEQQNNNVEDGLYVIEDKTIKKDDKVIDVGYKGNKMLSGGLLIEDGKVVRIIKGKIRDYYARIENGKIKLYKNIDTSTLVRGSDFNQKIKQLVGNQDATYETADTIVKEIIFLPESMLPKGYTKETLENLPNISVSSDNKVKAYYDNNGIVYIYSDNIIKGEMYEMFLNFKELTNITFNLLDTSNTTMLYRTFHGCSKLENVDLSNLDLNKVTNITIAFGGCSNLKEIKFGDFDASNVGEFSYTFSGCSSLEELDLSKWDTSKATRMDYMFNDCTSLKKIKGLENFNTSNVTHEQGMSSMFKNCSSLESIDLSNFDTKNVISMHSMFRGCSSLKKLDLTNFDTSSVRSMFEMFYDCSNLEKILVSDKWIINEGTNITYMFNGCKIKNVTYV